MILCSRKNETGSNILRAINSEGECLLDVEKVIGSNPILPTMPPATPFTAKQ